MTNMCFLKFINIDGMNINKAFNYPRSVVIKILVLEFNIIL